MKFNTIRVLNARINLWLLHLRELLFHYYLQCDIFRKMLFRVAQLKKNEYVI